ncbi:hypothetical protein [Streptomyces vinaceus]
MSAFGWSKGGTATACATLADEHLRNRRGHLLDGPSPAFPAVKFLP